MHHCKKDSEVESFLHLVYNKNMFIEDLINRLNSDGQFMFADYITLSPNDVTIIGSLSTQAVLGNGYTEKQQNLAVRLVKKYSRQLELALSKDISPFVNSPQFKLPARVLTTTKTIVLRKNEGTNRRVISINFPYDEQTVNKIREYKKLVAGSTGNQNQVMWDPETRAWNFDLREENIQWIENHLRDSSFVTDEMFLDLVKQIKEVKENIENYVPMVVFENNKFIFKNIPNSVPQPTSNDLVNVLVDARKYGITTWGEDIDIALEQIDVDPLLYSFLTSSVYENFQVDKTKTKFSDIVNVINHSLPCLIVVPGGSELRHLEICTKMIQKHGISDQEMTVLFRLDGENGKKFNNFVRDSKLNNPIHDNIKVAFISGKVPKPLIESKLNFSCILNLGISGVHYTLSNYLKNHNFVINYALKESDFAEL